MRVLLAIVILAAIAVCLALVDRKVHGYGGYQPTNDPDANGSLDNGENEKEDTINDGPLPPKKERLRDKNGRFIKGE